MEYKIPSYAIDSARAMYLELDERSGGFNNLRETFYHKNTDFANSLELIEDLNKTLGEYINVWYPSADSILLEYDNNSYLEIERGFSGGKYAITVFGDMDFINLTHQFKEDETAARVSFSYLDSKNEVREVDIKLGKRQNVYPEFYPFFDKPIDEYFNEYFKSDAAILIFIGEPGTGKTSLIRHLVHTHKLVVKTTSDENLMNMDEFYIDYINHKHENLLVIEDADLILLDRESAQNKLMSKLLNFSDGIGKLVDKKIIFTTNLDSTVQIDPALIRPGRCFGVVNFRALTLAESLAACKASGLELPDDNGTQYTLSELFNPEFNRSYKKSVGFIR